MLCGATVVVHGAALALQLRQDYQDFLRQRGLRLWAREDPRRGALVARRCTTADEVAAWVREFGQEEYGRYGLYGQDGPQNKRNQSMQSILSIQSIYAEVSANAALVLIGVACALLDRQLAAQAAAFEKEGGFTERLHRVRSARRKSQSTPPTPSPNPTKD